MKKDIILIMDTTRDELFLSLIVDGVEDRRLIEDCNSKHSVIMLEAIDKLLKDNQVDIVDVGIFALSVGSGSFTGIRIGVTTVKGFIYANKSAQVIAVNSLEANAYNHLDFKNTNISVIDAKHDNAYIGEYEVENGKLIEKSLGFTTKAHIEKLLQDGCNVTSPYENTLNVPVTENYYDGYVKLVLDKISKNDFSTKTFAPLYLKKSQAEEEVDGNC
ncbi:MAG: tRNA (adenosine(37)-N6)-threonylcarbamoyltransferase complex dimerization subunit type 1 TsaB [Clostridia bacterium]